MQILTLNDLLTRLRMEARISTNVAHGSHQTETYIALLRRVQEELYAEYDWPMLQTSQIVTVPKWARRAAYPTDLNFEGVKEVHAKSQAGKWFPLTYGIGTVELNQVDSDANENRPEIAKWSHYLSHGAEVLNQAMFEVWPIPDRDVELRFSGKRKLYPLVDADSDYTTLDGPTIALFAASEILAGQKAEDAQLKLAKAQARLDQMRRRQSAAAKPVNFAAPANRHRPRHGIDYVD